MGLQQGTLLRDALQQLVRGYLYGQVFSQGPAMHWGLLNYSRLLDHELRDDLRNEMLGIADGAALSYQDILLLNVLPDLQALTAPDSYLGFVTCALGGPSPGAELGEALHARPSDDETALGSSFAVWGSATENGSCFWATTWSGRPETGGSVVARGARAGAGQCVHLPKSIGFSGRLGRMNEEEMAVSLSASPSADIAPLGQPLPSCCARFWRLRQP